LRLAETEITIEEFNEFFKDHLKTNIVNSEEFGEIIAKHEDDILKIVGVG
jgi:lipid II:glycine glycyltransferase (peptidoglycan interpeptide bridge formation enzyme)